MRILRELAASDDSAGGIENALGATRVFCAKSAGMIENKRDAFRSGAKERRKSEQRARDAGGLGGVGGEDHGEG